MHVTDGSAATVWWWVPTGSIGGLREGATIPVRIDITDPQRIDPPWGGARWAATHDQKP